MNNSLPPGRLCSLKITCKIRNVFTIKIALNLMLEMTKINLKFITTS